MLPSRSAGLVSRNERRQQYKRIHVATFCGQGNTRPPPGKGTGAPERGTLPVAVAVEYGRWRGVGVRRGVTQSSTNVSTQPNIITVQL